jgi:hypothetical protein
MGEPTILYAIAESCPFDALLVRDMNDAVNSLLQLNLKRFRLPAKVGTRYSALDVMRQALELLFEFSPSERNYREAMRTIQVYSEGDEDMAQTLRASFKLIANAVYNAYTAQRHAEALSPEVLFLQGIPFEPMKLQQSFRFVGVKPPEVSPPNVHETVFLDEGFEPYKLLLDGKLSDAEAQHGREEHWAELIEDTLSKTEGKALIRARANHLEFPSGILARVPKMIHIGEQGKLSTILHNNGIQIKIIHRTADVNRVFGKR